jgi:zinc transport system ATP-binding protein
MSFFSKKPKNSHSSDKKIPPIGAWGHYNKKQGGKTPSSAATDEKATLISVNSLALSFENREIIHSLSFTVEEGDYLCIIGENGSGKSSLINALLGLIKPTSGKIIFKELNRSQIGVLPQQIPVERDFPATVCEVVTSGCLSRKQKGPFMSKDSKNIAFTNMEKLGITSLADRPFRELSGGQRQRVLISRALCAAEKLLILDEPVTGLDHATTADMYALFRDLNASGMTIISVTHDVKAALKYCNKILRVNKDSIFFGSTEEYLALPEAAHLMDEDSASEGFVPYGDGGFRYKGGDI